MKRWIFGLLIILIAGVIYYIFSPIESRIFPKCPFLWITGLKCPGCGSQRAIHSLLHLDIMKALYHNALLICSLPIVMILSLAEYYRCSKPTFYLKVHNHTHIWCYLVIIILWWIIRNTFNI